MEFGQQTSKQQKRSAYSLAFLSAMTAVVMKLMDAYISRNVITVPAAGDKVVAACVFLTLGGIIGSIILLALAHTPFGRIIDQQYSEFHLGTSRFQSNALIAGASGAVATGFYLLALQKGYDAATLIALASSRMLWTMAYEYLKNKIRMPVAGVVGPASLMIAGVWIGEDVSKPSLEAILLIFVVSALLEGISDVHDKMAAEESNATLATVWRFIYLGIFGTVLSVIYVWHIGKMPLYMNLLRTKLPLALPIIAVLMLFVFLTNGWSAKAKAHLDMGASKVVLISHLKIVGVLLALGVLNFVFGRSEFGQLPIDTFLLAQKILGAVVITAGVVWLVTNKPTQKNE